MAPIKPEELIESVRSFPVLYDQTEEQYRNSDYKDIIWKKVAKELNVEGQEEECKKKWNGIRDSLRRARQKRKTKSGQSATSIHRYKFESILEFLIPHLAERKGLSNVPDEEDDTDETQLNDSHQNSTKETLNIKNENESQETAESVLLLTPTTPASRISIDHRPLSVKRKRKLEVKPQESPSSQLMTYLLAEKEAKKKKESSKNVDAFLSGIATSLKSLHPIRFHSAKGKIFNIVQEYELQQLLENQQTEMVHTNNVSSDTTSFTISEEEGSYAHSSGSIQHTPTHPADTEETYCTRVDRRRDERFARRPRRSLGLQKM